MARGNLIEKILAATFGGGLPRTFPVIDRFKDGVATSVKSLDLAAQSYQNISRLTSFLTGFIDKLAGFQGGIVGESSVKGADISTRVLELVIQAGALTAEGAALDQLRELGHEMDIFVGVFDEGGNTMFTMEGEIMRTLARLSMGVTFDVYP